jgi:hypothetical protein
MPDDSRARFLLNQRHGAFKEIEMNTRVAWRNRLARFAPPSMQQGKMGYILLWLLGIPIPVLFVIFLLRGCT